MVPVRWVGSESWRFSESLDESVHTALYLRNALALDVPAGSVGHPPRLLGEVPDRRDLLGPEQRGELSRVWPGWWEAVVDRTAGLHGPAGGTSARFPASEDADAGPALREALGALRPEAARWAEPHRRASGPPTFEHGFGWALTSRVAEQVAADHGVRPGLVQGVALVLAVRGMWWVRARPGVVLCSVAAVDDEQTAEAVLREAFESQLPA